MPISQQLSTRFGKFVLCASLVSLFGCASQRVPYGPDKMASFTPDCRIAEQQIAWLVSMKPTVGEKMSNNFTNYFVGRLSSDTDYQSSKNISNGQMDWWIRTNLKEVYNQCKN